MKRWVDNDTDGGLGKRNLKLVPKKEERGNLLIMTACGGEKIRGCGNSGVHIKFFFLDEESDDETENRMQEELERSDEYSEGSAADEQDENEEETDEPLPLQKRKMEKMPPLLEMPKTPEMPLPSPPKRRREVFEVVGAYYLRKKEDQNVTGYINVITYTFRFRQMRRSLENWILMRRMRKPSAKSRRGSENG